jgi:heat shock protein HslJ
MSKKMIVYCIGGLVLLTLIGGVGYYFSPQLFPSKRIPPPPAKDLTGIIVAPVTFPMRGYSMMVPDNTEQVVTLDLVSPSARRDYPMARFMHSVTNTESMLVVYDDLVTDRIGQWRGVPISLSGVGTSTMWYLARLAQVDDEWRHVDSVYLGEDLRMSSVSVDGETVVVQYLVHDRNQVVTEVPRVSTTAIITLSTGVVVQAGRVPKSEALIEYKQFGGEYVWQSTTDAEGVVITPTAAERFTLRFDGNRVALGTDCNSGSATFVTEPLPATTFSVAPIASTKMFCESAQEAIYFAMIQQITSYEDTNQALKFTLADGGVMAFTPKRRDLPFADPADVVTTALDAVSTTTQ